MKKNICIVHYNTPVLTECLIKSINKHVKNSGDINIYIFDNSDTSPFTYRQNNIKYIDNTKGQIINFDEWGKNYPNKTKSFVSSKHGYSVQKCIEIINEPFILLDSDILLKQDINSFFDEKFAFIGELRGERILPFICFINTNILKEKNVLYFDDNHTYDLFKNGLKSKREDTGFMLYYNKEKLPHKYIKCSEYIEHYSAGSYSFEDFNKLHKGQISKEKWLEKFKTLWYYEEKSSKKIEPSVCEEKQKKKIKLNDIFNHIYCLHYLPASDRLPKLKDELKRVGIDENADYFSWVYDYPTPLLDNVYKDNRLNMNTALKSSSREYIKRVSMKHYEIAKEAYALGYERILILENDVRFHKDLDYINTMLSKMPDTDVVMFDKMVCSAPLEGTKYKKYVKTLPENALYGDMNASEVFFIFCSCYVLNRKAMKRIIELHEKGLLPPDTPLNDKSLTGSFAITNVAIQDPKMKARKAETYDKIGLDTSKYGPEETIVAASAKPEVVKTPTKAKTTTATTSSGPFKKPQPKPQPIPTVKRDPVPDKRKTMKIRIVHAKAYGHNKLYDV